MENANIKLIMFRICGVLLISGLVGITSVGQFRSEEDRVKVTELFNAGTILMGKGETQQAIQKFSEAISVEASFPYPYVNRAVAFVSLSKLPEALSDAEKAISLYKDDSFPKTYVAIAHQVKGTVFQNDGKYDAAFEEFSKAIELSPSDPKFYNSRGNLQRLRKNFEAALLDFNKGIELDPKLPHLLVNRGSVHFNLRNNEASLKDLDEAIKLDKTLSAAFLNRGNTHTEAKNYDAALSDYNQAIALASKPEYLYARGRLYLVLKKYDLAVKDNSDAITIDPKHASAFGNRAVAYGKMGKNALAVEDLRQAVALRPDSSVLRYNFSHQLYVTGRFTAAMAEVTKVIETSPNWRDPYILRSAIYSKLGNAVKARADRLTASKVGSGNRPFESELAFTLDIVIPEPTDQ